MAPSKHQAVKQHVADLISKMQPHQALPNERTLASELGVSRMTLRNVIAEMAAEGFVYTVHGSGTFVSEPRLSKEVLVSSFTEDMLRRGQVPSSRVLMAQLVTAPPAVAEALGLEADAKVYNIERVRMADGIPVCVEDAYLPAAEMPGLLEQRLDGSLYTVLRERYERRIVRAATTVSAISLNARQANLLGDRQRAAALRFERVTFDHRGRPLEHCVTIYRSGRFDLRYTVDL